MIDLILRRKFRLNRLILDIPKSLELRKKILFIDLKNLSGKKMNRTCVQLKKTTSLYLNLTNLFVLKIKSFNNRCYNCWSCDRLLSNKESRSFFCPCEKQKILPSNIAGTSYFDLFSIDSNYDIDKKTLTKNFRQLMRKLHPDLYTQSSEVNFRGETKKVAHFESIKLKSRFYCIERKIIFSRAVQSSKQSLSRFI